MHKAMIIKQARTLMLRSLDKAYPSGISVKMLEQIMCTVNESYGTDLMNKDIAYLREKGYIELVGFGGPATLADIRRDSFTVVKLTAAGTEIAQNLIHDSALEL